MKKLPVILALVLALLSACALATDADTETHLWPAHDENTGLWGYITEDGVWGINPQYERAYHFHGGCAIVNTMDVPSWQGESTQGIIDETGAYLLEPMYSIDDACCMDGSGLLYLVNQYDKMRGSGWFNIPNRYFSGLHWTECYAYSDTPYILINNGYAISGLADRATGKIVMPMEYDYTGIYDRGIENGFVVAERCESDGCELIEIGVGAVELPEGVYLDDVQDVSGGLILFSNEEGLYGYINTAGEVVIPARYDHAYDFIDGYAEVHLPEDQDTNVIIDREGNIVLREVGELWDMNYRGVVDDALLIVRWDASWSLIEPDGTVRCQYVFPEEPDAYDVDIYDTRPDAPLWVCYCLPDAEYLEGLLNRDGTWLVEPCWDFLTGADEWGWSAACVDGEWDGPDFVGTWGYVDLYGNSVLPFVYADAEAFDGPLARVRFDDATEGYINRAGETVFSWPAQED